jgi:hypothetical protein
MASGRKIRSYDYVNHRYERVRDALSADAAAVFRAATKAAAGRAESVASELRVKIGALEVSADIEISVNGITEEKGKGGDPVTRLELEWEAAKAPRLFPFMRATLSVYPLTSTETQLELAGQYVPPMGLLGGAADGVVGHRIAEASVHRFVTDVARHLRETLG